jgi:hypothetical protein
VEVLIQKLIRNLEGFSIDNLEAKKNLLDTYNIKVNSCDGCVLFKYHSIISEWTDLTIQTRGIVLDSLDNWKVVNFPFTKFFNIHESSAAVVDWSSASFQEKVDGSLIFIYFVERLNRWMISTSGTCNAFAAEARFGKSFGQIVTEVLTKNFKDINTFYSKLQKNICYMFELESSYNQVVVNQGDNEGRLTILGARNLDTLEELSLNSSELARIQPLSVVKTYPITQDTMINFVNSRPAQDAEGLVVCDSQFNRIKVKSEEYIKIHRAVGGILSSWKNALELALSDDIDDFKGVLGSAALERIDLMQTKVNTYISEYKNLIDNLPESCLQNRKEMGQYIKENKLDLFSTFIWQCHFGGKNILSVLKGLVDKNAGKVADTLMENF